MYKLNLSQSQTITYVMIDIAGTEVTGLAGGCSVEVSKNGGAFAASAGAKAEIGHGWYSYTLTQAETNTVGPLSIRVTGAGAIQQNLAYVVEAAIANSIEFTYTVIDDVTLLPIQGVEVWVTTDVGGTVIVWNGTTDSFGVARDAENDLPRLEAGTYYFWRNKSGYVFTDPDTEVVSNP